jgi:hypothetical protein
MNTFTVQDMETVNSLIQAFAQLSYDDQMRMMGSEGVDRVLRIRSKINTFDYCLTHNTRWEDMTETDFDAMADEEMWDYDDADYSSNMPCDTYGMCAGSSCSHYYQCQA